MRDERNMPSKLNRWHRAQVHPFHGQLKTHLDGWTMRKPNYPKQSNDPDTVRRVPVLSGLTRHGEVMHDPISPIMPATHLTL